MAEMWNTVGKALVWTALLCGGMTLHSVLGLPMWLGVIWVIPPVMFTRWCGRYTNREVQTILGWLPFISLITLCSSWLPGEWGALLSGGSLLTICLIGQSYRAWRRRKHSVT